MPRVEVEMGGDERMIAIEKEELLLKKRRLPIVISKKRFEKFLEEFNENYPEEEFPDFELKYQEMSDGRIAILGFGPPHAAITDALRVLDLHPEDVEYPNWKTRVLRRSRRVLLR